MKKIVKNLSIALVTLFCFIVLILQIFFPLQLNPQESVSDLRINQADSSELSSVSDNGNINSGLNSFKIGEVSLTIPSSSDFAIPDNYSLNSNFAIPTFVKLDGTKKLIIDANKYSVGEHKIYFKDSLSEIFNDSSYIELKISSKQVDIQSIKNQIQNHLASIVDNYGIYIVDLTRNIEFGINEQTQFKAASIVKVPIAITVLKEIQDGNLSLDTIYPLQDRLVFSYDVGAGLYPEGSELKVRDYLNLMLTQSDNTSLSHLDSLLSERYGSDLNARIKSITGVDFYVYPPETTPYNVAKVFEGLYTYKFLNKEYSEYLLNFLINALPDLKTGISLGVPSEVTVANKIGFLYSYEDLSYMDSGIVYAPNADYIIVVMDKNQSWSFAQYNILNISSIIYNNLN